MEQIGRYQPSLLRSLPDVPTDRNHGPGNGGKTLVYVLAVFPTVSQTFVSGEIGELVRRGVDVRVFSLRKANDAAPLHPGIDKLVDRTTYVPFGRSALPGFATAVLALFARHPVRATKAMV